MLYPQWPTWFMIHGVTVYVLVIVYFSYYTGSDYNAVWTHFVAARLKKQTNKHWYRLWLTMCFPSGYQYLGKWSRQTSALLFNSILSFYMFSSLIAEKTLLFSNWIIMSKKANYLIITSVPLKKWFIKETSVARKWQVRKCQKPKTSQLSPRHGLVNFHLQWVLLGVFLVSLSKLCHRIRF